MSTATKSKTYSRRTAGVFLLVGLLAGVTIGGGGDVIAASSTKSVTVCADKKTNVLRYAKSKKCLKTEMALNFSGVQGDAGAAGVQGDALTTKLVTFQYVDSFSYNVPNYEPCFGSGSDYVRATFMFTYPDALFVCKLTLRVVVP